MLFGWCTYSLLLDGERWKQADVPAEIQFMVQRLENGNQYMYMYMYICIYMYMYVHVHVLYILCIHIIVHMYMCDCVNF